MSVKSKEQSSGEIIITKIPIYKTEEKISGKLDISSRKKFDHLGIKIELIGMIEIGTDSSVSSMFMSNGLDLEPPGTQNEDRSYNFSFAIFQKPYESYYGNNVKLRYFLRATVLQSKFKSACVKELDVGVLIAAPNEEVPVPINLEVGIDEFLNIKIDFPKNCFELKEIIEGKISFLLVKLPIKKMELIIVRKEIVGVGEKANTTSDELCTFEIMDGCPIKGQLNRRRNTSEDVFWRNVRVVTEYVKYQQQVYN